MRGSIGAIGTVALVLMLLGPTLASARTEAGNPCIADDSAAGWTVIGLTRPPDVFMQPMIWGDVITRWQVNVAAGKGPLAQRLQVFRHTFAEEEERYRKVGESGEETLVAGSNAFATRIPLSGEGPSHIGLRGPAETLFCDKQAMTLSAVALEDFPQGESRPFKIESGIGTPVVVFAESDLDRDGYGDETQDGCPRSAATQGDCPTVTVSVSAPRVTPGAIVVQLRTTSEGWVEVKGEVGWKLPLKAGKGAKGSKRIGRRFVASLKATEGKTVLPGTVATFRVPLPKSVKRRLAGLPRGRALRARLTATAEDLAYRETSTELSVKLRGRKQGVGRSDGRGRKPVQPAR